MMTESGRNGCFATAGLSKQESIQLKGKSACIGERSTVVRRLLHEFDRSAVGIAHVDDLFPGVWSRGQGLRLTGGSPSRAGNCRQHRIKIVDRKGDVDGTDTAGPESDPLAF